MNEQTQSGERVIYERCVCREAAESLGKMLGISPAVKQHLINSRVEFLKAIRSVIDDRITHLSQTAQQQGTKVTVE